MTAAIQVLVAWANNPLDDITTFVTVGPNPAAGQWTDISPWVVEKADWARGRQHELGHFEAGTFSCTVDNNDGRFSPWNTASPYNGFLLPMKWLQVRASTGNRLSADDASFETTIGGWVANSACTVARDGTIGADGGASLKLTATAASAFSARSTACAVRAGAMYTALASLRATVAGLHCTVGLTWLDSTGAVISTSTGSSTVIPNGSFGQATVTAVAPTNAAAVRLLATCTDNVTNGLVLNLDKASIAPGTSTTWAAGMTPRWTGHIHSYPIRWPDNFTEFGELQASDAFRFLSLVNITSTKYAATVLADGATAYYRLGDSSAVANSRMVDSVGTNHGTYQGVLTALAEGALLSDVDTAVDFGVGLSGRNYGFAFIPYAVLPSGATDRLSVELWWKANTDFGSVTPGAPSGQIDVLQLPDYTSTLIGGGISVLGPGNPYSWPTGRVSFLLADGTRSIGPIFSALGVNYADGQWHHFVMVLESDLKTLHAYVDGALVATGTSGTAFNFATGGTRVANMNSIMGSGTEGFVNDADGIVDEVAFYKNVSLTAAQVAAHYTLGAGAWANQLSGVRMTSVLDTIGWPAALRSIAAGASTLQAVTDSLVTTKALAHMQAVEITEAGALFMNRRSVLTWLDRTTIAQGNYGVAAFTLGDDALPSGSSAELPFRPGPDMALDDIDLYNEVTVQRVGGVLQPAADATSQTAYGRRTRAITGTLSAGDAESLYRAQFEVSQYKQPLFRLRTATVDLADDPRIPAAVFASELMQLIAIKRHGITGDVFTETALIEHIAEHWTPDRYTADFALSPTQAQQYWQLGTSALGTGTVLGF